jgi:hypothetical protein
VRIADAINEEFPKAALRAVTGGDDKGGGVIGEDDELVHFFIIPQIGVPFGVSEDALDLL